MVDSQDILSIKAAHFERLRGFCCVVQAKSVTRAAERLSLSQPAVSLQIRTLEKDLAVRLFERHGPKLQLTPEGELLYELAQPLVEAMDTLPQNFAAARGGLGEGKLDIAAGESTILYLLPPLVCRYQGLYPATRLNLHNVPGEEGLELVRANQADFAVGPMLDVPQDLSYWPMYAYDPMLIMPQGHPLSQKEKITLEDISQYGLVLPPRTRSTWRFVRLVFRQHHLEFKVALEVGGWEVVKKYVAVGAGISIVTSICLTGEENLVVVPLGEYFPKRTYGVVVRKDKVLTPHAKRFIALMDPEVAKALAEKPKREGRALAR